jgi:hypothetical protein
MQVVRIDKLFVLSRDGDGIVVCRGGLNGLPADTDGDFRILPSHVFNSPGWKQNFLSRPPVHGGYFHVADRPIFIVHQKTVHVADFSVSGVDVVADDFFLAPQTRVAGVRRCREMGWCASRVGLFATSLS